MDYLDHRPRAVDPDAVRQTYFLHLVDHNGTILNLLRPLAARGQHEIAASFDGDDRVVLERVRSLAQQPSFLCSAGGGAGTVWKRLPIPPCGTPALPGEGSEP